MLNSFLEEDELQLPCTLQIVLIDLALEIVDNFLQLFEVLIAGLASLETQNLGEVTVFHLLHLYSLGKSLTNHRAVAEEPLSVSHIVEPVPEDSLDLVRPEREYLFGVVHIIRGALEDPLEDAADIPQVKEVMKFARNGQELLPNRPVKIESGKHYSICNLLRILREDIGIQESLQDGSEYFLEVVLGRFRQAQHHMMPYESRIQFIPASTGSSTAAYESSINNLLPE